MPRESKLLRLLVLLFAFALVAAACGDSDDEGAADDTTDTTAAGEGGAGDEPVEGSEGGTLIWAHEQEPPDMHLDDPENNLTTTSWVLQALVEGLYGITADTQHFPELLVDEPEIVENDDGTVTLDFQLRDGLMWSDGEPLTTEDVQFTWDVIREGCETEADGSLAPEGGEGCVFLLGQRLGYDTITSFDVASDTEFSITFSEFFAGFRDLFLRLWPAHAFGGTADAATVNEALRTWTSPTGETLPSSGPMVFSRWDRGVSMELVRNDTYHGSQSPDVRNTGPAHVDGVRLNFVTDTDAQVNALLSGEATMIFTQPQTQFERLATNDQITVASLAGPVYEHWGFNLLNVHLGKPEVREAIAYALDKSEVIEGLYAPLFGDLLPIEGLGNTYWMTNQPAYEDHQSEYHGAQIEEAQAKLEAVGYTQGSDGVYEHPQDGRLSLRVGTTGGNKLREDQQQIIQQQLADAGIEIVIDNVPGSAYFTERVFSDAAVAASTTQGAEGDPNVWDITQFAWVGGPWPGSNTTAYTSGSGNNPYAFANPDFDEQARSCETMTEDQERAECYNTADKYVTTLEMGDDGLVVIPITQKPSFYAYSSEQLAQGAVSPDANNAGPLVNVVDYQFR